MRRGQTLSGVTATATLVGFLVACGEVGSGGTDSGAPDAWFEEVAARAGLDFTHVAGTKRRFWLPEIMGSGLGFADVDQDGNLDLYVVQGGDLVERGTEAGENRLFRNLGNRTFEDATREAGVGDRGYGMGCAFGDADGDGRVDLYVTNLGPNALYRNGDRARFEDVTARWGVGDPRWGTSAAFLDYDADGDLDLFVVNYLNWSSEREIECKSPGDLRDYCSPKNFNAPASDVLYRNEDGLGFTDVSEASGLTRTFGNGLGLACADFDQDGHLDVYVANDLMPNQLWLGRGDGTFRDEALLRGCAVNADGQSEAGMGCLALDHDDDGDQDLFLTHLNGQTNTFYENEGELFVDHTDALGLGIASLPFTGFGVGAHDFDHDGRLDLFVANGRVTRDTGPQNSPVFDQPNQLFRGVTGGRFEEVRPPGGTPVLLLGTSRGAAFGDYDNDGDVDIAYVDNGEPLRLLENCAGGGAQWIMLRLLEHDGVDALGARVRVTSAGHDQERTVQTAYSYCSSNDPRLHFGLGAAAEPVEAQVRWIDGQEERFSNLETERSHVLIRGRGRPTR